MYLGQVQGSCGTKQGYAKKEKCDVIEALPAMLLLAQIGETFPADAGAFKDALQGYINEGKIIPVSGLAGAEAEGGDAATAQVGSYGPNRVTGINAYVRTFAVDGGDCLFKALKDLQGQWGVFVLDKNMYLRGYVKENNGAEVFCGHDADVFVTETEATGGTVYSISVRVAYGVDYDNQRKNRHTIKLDTMPDGLVGVVLQKVSDGKVKVVSACGGTDYTTLFKETVAPAMFIDNTGKAVTTATYNEDDDTVTLSPTTAPVRVAGADVLSENEVFGIGGIDKFVNVGA